MLKRRIKKEEAESTSKRDVFEATMFKYVDELYATALRYTHNEKDAEDLVQDTFLKAYQNLDKFKEGTNARAWLFTILTNTFINKFRRKKKEREILGADDLRPVRQNFHDLGQVELQQNPESRAMHSTFSEELRDSLEAIPEEFRMVVVLADLNDFSYKEIAHILDCPVGTVMSRLFRGRKLLRASLVDAAFDRGIIRERETFLDDETNKTRKSARKVA